MLALPRRNMLLGISATATMPIPQAFAASASEEQNVWLDVRLIGTDGRSYELGQSTSPLLIVHLWASWCAPCHNELAALSATAPQLRQLGAELIIVSYPKYWDADQAFLRQNRISLPAYTLAENTTWEARTSAFGFVSGSFALPQTLMFAGSARQCVFVGEGAQDWRSPQMAQRLHKMLRSIM